MHALRHAEETRLPAALRALPHSQRPPSHRARRWLRPDRRGMAVQCILDSDDGHRLHVGPKAAGPQRAAAITPQMLLLRPSAGLFGSAQNAGMGWEAALLRGNEFLLLSIL